MKTKLFKLGQICGWLLVAQTASAYRVPVFAELNNQMTLDGDTRSKNSELFVSGTFKINDQFSIVPELKTDFVWQTAKRNHTEINHKYLRVWLHQYGVAQIGGWKLDLGYRYRLPTEDSYQNQGSYGQLGVRPSLSGSLGPISLTVRDLVVVYLQRDGTTYRSRLGDPSPRFVGNPLTGHTLEILPSYDIIPGLTVAASWALTNVFNAESGQKSTFWSNEFEQEYEIGYKGSAIADTYVGVSYYTTVDPGKSDKWFDSRVSKINLKLSREF